MDIKLYLDNALDATRRWPAGSVELVVTSPPYKSRDGWSEGLMSGVFEGLHRAMSPLSLLFLNFGQLAVDPLRAYRTCQLATQAGFTLQQTIIWVKHAPHIGGHFTPLQGNRLYVMHESVFMLFPGDRMPIIDRLAIGIPYQDKSNIERFGAAGRPDMRCAGDIWYIPYPTVNKQRHKWHRDGFPLELPTRCLKLAPWAQSVADPFCGSGAVAVAAARQGRSHFYGSDREAGCLKATVERLSLEPNRQELHIEVFDTLPFDSTNPV